MANNSLSLKQLRDGAKAKIVENPSFVTFERAALIDNGYGVMIPDPDGATTGYSETVRISHEKTAVQNNAEAPTGLSTSFGLFMTMSYDSNIIEGDVILVTETSDFWRVGPVDSFSRFGDVYMLQAVLVKAQ